MSAGRGAWLVALLAVVATPAGAAAPLYPPRLAQSSLTFRGVQQGTTFTGTIRDYDAVVAYAPEDLATSRLVVTLRLRSIDTRSSERDQTLAGADWFDFGHFPTATFRSTSIRRTPAGPVADAELTIKGHVRRLAFPFTWAATPAGATLDARVTLDRADFGLGTGDWLDESLVGRKVEVIVHLVLGAPTAALPGRPPNRSAAPQH